MIKPQTANYPLVTDAYKAGVEDKAASVALSQSSSPLSASRSRANNSWPYLLQLQ